jgi:hypothetical protein
VLLLRLALDHNSPTYVSQVAGITGVHHYTSLFVEIRSH